MRENIVTRLASALQNRDSSALFELFDPYAEISDPLIGVVRRKYARCYAAITFHLFSDMAIEVSQVVDSVNLVTAHWKASISLSKRSQKKIEPSGLIIIEVRQERIYKVDLDFNYWQVLGSMFGLKGYLFGLTGFVRKKIRRKAINQIKELLARKGEVLPMTSSVGSAFRFAS